MEQEHYEDFFLPLSHLIVEAIPYAQPVLEHPSSAKYPIIPSNRDVSILSQCSELDLCFPGHQPQDSEATPEQAWTPPISIASSRISCCALLYCPLRILIGLGFWQSTHSEKLIPPSPTKDHHLIDVTTLSEVASSSSLVLLQRSHSFLRGSMRCLSALIQVLQLSFEFSLAG